MTRIGADEQEGRALNQMPAYTATRFDDYLESRRLWRGIFWGLVIVTFAFAVGMLVWVLGGG